MAVGGNAAIRLVDSFGNAGPTFGIDDETVEFGAPEPGEIRSLPRRTGRGRRRAAGLFGQLRPAHAVRAVRAQSGQRRGDDRPRSGSSSPPASLIGTLLAGLAGWLSRAVRCARSPR